jgi:hypothetical protein
MPVITSADIANLTPGTFQERAAAAGIELANFRERAEAGLFKGNSGDIRYFETMVEISLHLGMAEDGLPAYVEGIVNEHAAASLADEHYEYPGRDTHKRVIRALEQVDIEPAVALGVNSGTTAVGRLVVALMGHIADGSNGLVGPAAAALRTLAQCMAEDIMTEVNDTA